MSWSLERREEGWCVLGEDGSVAGSHESRADAIKHQRRLYATEARVASMYAELDAQPEPEPEPVVAEVPQTSPVMAEILALLAREQQEKSLVASVAEQQSLISQQFAEAAAERQALVAALGRMGSPTINLPEMRPPDVTVNVPPAEVNFHAPAPEVTVNVPAAEVTVHSPDVNVTIEAPPPVQKTVTFERDPLTHQVTKAEVIET
jgi:hypothetical protein